MINKDDIKRRFKSTSLLIGVTHTSISYEDSLFFGFEFASSEHKVFNLERPELLSSVLRKLELTDKKFQDLNIKEKISRISQHLLKEKKELDKWFMLGYFTYFTTTILSSKYAANTDHARDLIDSDEEVRASLSNLYQILLDLKWSPDETEKFVLEKLIPFLYEENLRKWAGHPSIAVMSDFRHYAVKLDSENEKNTWKNRGISSCRSLVSSIPFVGGAIAILVFGPEKK